MLVYIYFLLLLLRFEHGLNIKFKSLLFKTSFAVLRWLVGLKMLLLEQQKAQLSLIILEKNLKPILCRVIKAI